MKNTNQALVAMQTRFNAGPLTMNQYKAVAVKTDLNAGGIIVHD